MDAFTAIDDAQIRQGTFQGWTLPELPVLHAYRARPVVRRQRHRPGFSV